MTETTAAPIRDSGLSVVGDVPWGTHFSLYYKNRRDLLEVVVPFLEAGIRANEMCVWVWPDQDAEREGCDALRSHIRDLDARVARGQIQFLSVDAWYRDAGEFRVEAILRRLHDVYAIVESRGFAGFRGAGDVQWIDSSDYELIEEYERQLDDFVHSRRAVILCTYQSDRSPATSFVQSTETHAFVLARCRGRWIDIETPQSRRAVHEIERLNTELEQRVEQRTAELFAERRRTRARLARAKRRAREQALEARFAAILEERTRLARDIHDSLLQGVAGIALQLRAVLPRLRSASQDIVDSVRRIVDLADATARDARQTVWEMRPLALAHGDLAASLQHVGRRVSSNLTVHVDVCGEVRPLSPVVEDTILRIAQESATNAVKHGAVSVIGITVRFHSDAVELIVTDAGGGFDVDSAFRAYTGRWGLLGMRERAHRVGGTLTVESTSGQGTTVRLEVPLREMRAREVS